MKSAGGPVTSTGMNCHSTKHTTPQHIYYTEEKSHIHSLLLEFQLICCPVGWNMEAWRRLCELVPHPFQFSTWQHMTQLWHPVPECAPWKGWQCKLMRRLKALSGVELSCDLVSICFMPGVVWGQMYKAQTALSAALHCNPFLEGI